MNHTKFHIKFITALLLSCIFLYSCENDSKKIKSLTQKQIGIEQADNVVLNYTISGKAKAMLTAPLMYNVQDTIPYVEFPKTLHVDFYNDSQIIESKMNAHYAKYKQYQSKVFLKDSVVIINMARGDTLYCNELYWDRNKIGSEFYTDKPVRIRTKTEVIDGLGMESSQDFKNWRILHSVGRLSVPASSFPN
jgi:LPS export ABC transporter protein LptC